MIASLGLSDLTSPHSGTVKLQQADLNRSAHKTEGKLAESFAELSGPLVGAVGKDLFESRLHGLDPGWR